MSELISFKQYLAILSEASLREAFSPVAGDDYLCVDISDVDDQTMLNLSLPPCPVIGVRDTFLPQPMVDLVVPSSGIEEVIARIRAQPIASATLVQLLRHNAHASIADGLFAESLAYSTLQHSTGFEIWLEGRTESVRSDEPTDTPPLLVEQDGTTLVLTFNRPTVHNAYNMALKDDLCAALHAAAAQTDLHEVRLTGNGPSFCAGGDLTEFGRARDAGTAHLSRVTRSAGFLLSDLTQHTVCHLHGACIGAGIEIPAFADRLIAEEESFFQLPEIGFGLVPGAGGTVSVTRRIGRHRTAQMAITGERVDAPKALAWGLIDTVA